MNLTGKNIKDIRKYLSIQAKDFGIKAGLAGSHIPVTVYRWESEKLGLSSKTLSNIKKMFLSKRLVSIMEILAHSMAENDAVPEKINLVVYPDEDIYKYFHGDDAPPFWLYQETNEKITALIKNLGIAVSLVEINQQIYEKWLKNRNLEDSQQNRVMFHKGL